MKNKDRISYIDVARGIAAFLVVLGHVLDKGVIRQMIYQIHMPLFFVLSGMLLNPKCEKFSFKQFTVPIGKRARDCLIPYVVWGLFYSKLRFKNLWKLIYGSREMLVEIKSLSSLWFLPVIFIASVISEGVLWGLRRSGKLHISILLSAFLLFVLGFNFPHKLPYGWPFGMDIAFVAAAFMLLGLFIRRNFSEFAKKERAYLCLPFAVVTMSLLFALNQWVPIRVSMHKAKYGNAVLFVLYALLGTVAILLFSLAIDRIFLFRKIMSCVGINTIGILCTHKLFLNWMVKLPGPKYVFTDSNFFLGFGIAVLGTIFSIIATKLILHVDPILVGKNQK